MGVKGAALEAKGQQLSEGPGGSTVKQSHPFVVPGDKAFNIQRHKNCCDLLRATSQHFSSKENCDVKHANISIIP